MMYRTLTNNFFLGAEIQNQLQNASILTALESKFNTLNGKKSTYIQSLPQSIRKRIFALKNLSKKNLEIEKELQKEIHELEKKYFILQCPIYEKRSDIISGKYEPSEEECFRSEREQDELDDDVPLPDTVDDTVADTGNDNDQNSIDEKGIPEFWSTCLKNLPPLQDVITPEDDGALKHLIDIRYAYLEGNPV